MKEELKIIASMLNNLIAVVSSEDYNRFISIKERVIEEIEEIRRRVNDLREGK